MDQPPTPQSLAEAMAQGWEHIRATCRCGHSSTPWLRELPLSRCREPLAVFVGRLYCQKCDRKDVTLELLRREPGALSEESARILFDGPQVVLDRYEGYPRRRSD